MLPFQDATLSQILGTYRTHGPPSHPYLIREEWGEGGIIGPNLSIRPEDIDHEHAMDGVDTGYGMFFYIYRGDARDHGDLAGDPSYGAE